MGIRLLWILLLANFLWAGDIQVQWMALDIRTGEPLAHLVFLVDGDTLRADEGGMAQSTYRAVSQTLQVRSTIDTLIVTRDTFSIDSTQATPFFALEFQVKQKNVAKASQESEKKSTDMLVVARREPLHDRKEISRIEVSREEMQEVVGIQNDPLQVVRMLPGVTGQNDANQRPYVRGGDWWETRVFWNGVPVLQPFHSMSLYSIFNLEGIEDMEFYSGGFPVEGNNSLSGAIFLRKRQAALDSFELWTQISMLKGHLWTGIPILKDKLSATFSFQSFWYDWVLKRGMDVATWVADNKDFSKQVDQYQSLVDLPNFTDLEFGWQWAISPRAHFDYSYLQANDIFRILQPDEESIGNGQESWNLSSIDTLAIVEIPNTMHAANLRLSLSNRWDALITGSWQKQEWFVDFAETEPVYDYARDQYHIRWQNLYRWDSKHLFSFGAMAENEITHYDVSMPRVAYELLMQSNIDMIESMAYIAPDGMTMTNSPFSSDINQIIETLYMDYQGIDYRKVLGGWFSDKWTLDSNNRIELGTRIDYEQPAQSVFLSPRASWFHRLSPRQEITLGTGLYSQDNYEFYYRHYNQKLLSEKAWHANAEWSMDLTPDYRIEVSNYGKYYYDLATPHLVPTGTISFDALESAMEQWFGMDPDSVLGNDPDNPQDVYLEDYRNAIGEPYFSMLVQALGFKTLAFDNSGIGYAIGSEVRLHYDPTRIWRGWISAEASRSERQDKEDGRWYAFRKHRPWAIKWHNYFDMPGDWELSLRLEHSAGLAYTGYTVSDLYSDGYANESDTLFVVDPKNNKRYSSYTRFDIRLERNSTLFGHPFMTFFEVWNSFNTPNFLLTDNQTGELKFMDLNYPFPIYFTGVEFRW